jgi:hypothetical protein
MRNNERKVRIIKRSERADAERALEDAPAPEARAANSEREMRTVVSGWVREHKERTEEFRSAFASLLRAKGFRPSRLASRA